VLQRQWKRSGVQPEALKMPEVPDEMAYLWGWYSELKRDGGPLAWGMLESWSRMTATPICGRDAAALIKIDDAILRSARE
jgi:hypothetical protein